LKSVVTAIAAPSTSRDNGLCLRPGRIVAINALV
jgi:hypothetical protein